MGEAKFIEHKVVIVVDGKMWAGYDWKDLSKDVDPYLIFQVIKLIENKIKEAFK